MLVRVLKGFPYAHDTKTTQDLTEGEDVEVRDELVEGLVAEGYISTDLTGEAASKAAGAAIAHADLSGTVDSDAAVKEDIAQAEAGISDGHIGAPEAAAIVDEHKVTPLSSDEVKDAAVAEAVEHGKDEAEVRSALDHDGNGKDGGSIDELDQKKVEELKDIAEKETVDLKGITRRDDIIEAIRDARKTKAGA